MIREESRIAAGGGLFLKELGHHPAHAVADVHVGFGVATVVTVGASLPPEKAGHFMIGRTRVVVADIFQGLFVAVSVSVLLEAGIPSLAGQRLPLRVVIVALVGSFFGAGAGAESPRPRRGSRCKS